MNFLALPLSHSKLNTKAHNVAHQNFGQHSQETVTEEAPEIRRVTAAEKGVLVTYVVHTEQQSRHQSDNHKENQSLRVHGIVDIHAAALGRRVGHEGEGLKAIHHRAQAMQFAALLYQRMDIVEKLLNGIHHIFSFLRVSRPCLTILCSSNFDEQTNSARAKSSGATS